MPLLDEPPLQPSVGGLCHSKKATLRISTLREKGQGSPRFELPDGALSLSFSKSLLCLLYFFIRVHFAFLDSIGVENAKIMLAKVLHGFISIGHRRRNDVVIPDYSLSACRDQGLDVILQTPLFKK